MDNDKIIKKLLDHDEQFVAIREEIRNSHDSLMNVLDQQTVILNRLDQEREFTLERVKRVEAEVEDSAKDIQKIKQVLKIV